MKVTVKEANDKRNTSSKSWKHRIAEWLMDGNQGSSCLEVYEGTRPGDTKRLSTNKVKGVQSEVTYLRNENYIVDVDDGKIFLVGVPDKDGKNVNIVEDQVDRFKSM